jgi:hypothetical protein
VLPLDSAEFYESLFLDSDDDNDAACGVELTLTCDVAKDTCLLACCTSGYGINST